MESHFRRVEFFFGKCKNRKYEAFKKEVIFRALKDGSSLPEEGLIFDDPFFENFCWAKIPEIL